MLRRSFTALCALTIIFVAPYGYATVTLGQKAPEFTAKDVSGKTVNLADFKGKTVVLEWVNPGCPFVRKHYNGVGNMQSTQKDAAAKGVVWLAINSTEIGHSDYLEPAKLGAWMKEKTSVVNATLMDESGSIGKAYGAKTTPHMYIVNPQGNLVYAGGIDSIPSAREGDIAKATNYVKAALAEVAQGKAISSASTAPYGCSVKYKS
jgi:alkyl hydroperoxide reductase subunit AhpC